MEWLTDRMAMGVRTPVTLSCTGTPESPHEAVMWRGSVCVDDPGDTMPACFVCESPGTPDSKPWPSMWPGMGPGAYWITGARG